MCWAKRGVRCPRSAQCSNVWRASSCLKIRCSQSAQVGLERASTVSSGATGRNLARLLTLPQRRTGHASNVPHSHGPDQRYLDCIVCGRSWPTHREAPGDQHPTPFFARLRGASPSFRAPVARPVVCRTRLTTRPHASVARPRATMRDRALALLEVDRRQSARSRTMRLGTSRGGGRGYRGDKAAAGGQGNQRQARL